MIRDEAVEREIAALVDTAEKDASILAVMLFGSRARANGHEGSDVDVCLVICREVAEALGLSEIKHRYLSRFDLDVQLFQQLPLHMRHRVLREGRVLYVRDESALYEVAFRSAQRYEDFRHRHEAYLQEVARG